MAEFAAWNNFYVIVGSAAGALIGLQFVVMTLIADRPRLRTPEAGAAFATPSVVHFGVVLLLSAVASAPWHALSAVAVFWGFIGRYLRILLYKSETYNAPHPRSSRREVASVTQVSSMSLQLAASPSLQS